MLALGQVPLAAATLLLLSFFLLLLFSDLGWLHRWGGHADGGKGGNSSLLPPTPFSHVVLVMRGRYPPSLPSLRPSLLFLTAVVSDAGKE